MIVIYNIQTGKYDVNFGDPREFVYEVVMYFNEYIISEEEEKNKINEIKIKLWDLQTGNCINIFPVYFCLTMNTWKEIRNIICVLPDGSIVKDMKNILKIWNMNGTSKPLGTDTELSDDHYTDFSDEHYITSTGHTKNINAIIVLPDGRIVSGSGKTIKIWC